MGNATILEVKDVIAIRKRKKDLLFKNLERIQEEILLAKTSEVSNMDLRKELMNSLANGKTYSIHGITRKILEQNIDSVKAEDLI